MKIYVAGKWQDRHIVKYVQQQLIGMGHKITVDWTRHEYDENGIVADEKQLAKVAVEDAQGAADAEVFVGVMVNDYQYKGLWVELGIAIHKGIPCYLLGKYGTSCIFSEHPLVRRFFSIEDFLAFFRRAADKDISRDERWYKGKRHCFITSPMSPRRTVKVQWDDGSCDIVPIRLCYKRKGHCQS